MEVLFLEVPDLVEAQPASDLSVEVLIRDVGYLALGPVRAGLLFSLQEGRHLFLIDRQGQIDFQLFLDSLPLQLRHALGTTYRLQFVYHANLFD